MAIVTSLFSKSQLVKMFCVHNKTKSWSKGGFGKWSNSKSRWFCIKENNLQSGSFFLNECRGERVRSQIMKGLALTSQENLFVCFNCSYSILILSPFFAFPCSSSCFCLISAYFQIIILNRYSNVTERESIHCWQRQVTTVWCSVIEHLCDIIIELRIV